MSRQESLATLRASHTPKAIRQRLESGPVHSYLRDFVYGAIDGAVTTFAIVSGVAGAGLSASIVVVLGIANLIGDGFSMAVSNYLGTKAEEQFRHKVRRMEEHHVETIPEGEKEEVRQIYAEKGFSGSELERAVEIITSDRKRWVETMLKEEWGLSLSGPIPWRSGLSTFSAFIVAGAIPLLVFIYQLFVPEGIANPFFWSSLLTGMAFFLIGAFKSRVVDEPWYRAGFETLAMGSVAASLAFFVGRLLKNIL